MSKKLVLIEKWKNNNNAIKITLNNPNKMNALSLLMMKELMNALHNITQNKNDIKVIILNGNGKLFSSGHDLNELYNNANNKEYLDNIFYTCKKLMFAFKSCNIPIIGMCHGIGAYAAGLQLLLCCDMIYTTKNCVFQTPGVNIGLFCHTPSIELINTVGIKHANEMLFTGIPINATKAKDIGLINDYINTDSIAELSIKVDQIVHVICSKSINVLKRGKQNIRNQLNMNKNMNKIYDDASQFMVNGMQTKDAQYGINCFFKKRKPNWNDLQSML